MKLMRKARIIRNVFMLILILTIYIAIHLNPVSTARIALISYGSFSGTFQEVSGSSNNIEYYLMVGNKKKAYIALEKSKLGLWRVSTNGIINFKE